MRFRPITDTDIPALFAVRIATDQNRLSQEDLTRLGITEASVRAKLSGTFKGWLCEIDGNVAGFAMGDSQTGELWVIAVLPEHIRKGIGSRLLDLVEQWLAESGCQALWLTTDMDTSLRAYSFYTNRGWEDDRIQDGLRYMKKTL